MDTRDVAPGSAVFLDAQSQEMITVQRCVTAIRTWFAEEFTRLHNERPQQVGGILYACPVWGAPYVARFAAACVPSLLAPENAAALANGRSRIVLFTDEAGVFFLAQAKRRLEAAGIDVRLHLIPTPIVAMLGENRQNRYTMLSAVHNIGVHMAGRIGSGFNMMAGDHIYARDFAPNLERMAGKYHGIVQSALSANLATVGRALGRYMDGERRLIVPGDRLNAIAWRHLHPQMRWMTVGMNRRNTTTRLPGATWLAWRGVDRLVVISPHMNVTYLSPIMCRFAPTCLPDTLDTALPRFMPAGAYIAKPEDGLAYIEVSDADKGYTTENLTVDQWVENLWRVVRFKEAYLPFMAPTEIAIPRSDEGTAAAAIERQRAALMQALVSALPRLREQIIEQATAA